MARVNGRLSMLAIGLLLLGLTACGVGYHFSGVQAIADGQGQVHAAAAVDIETEGGGGMVRIDLASFGADGELAEVIFATHGRLTRVTVVLATGEQQSESLGVD